MSLRALRGLADHTTSGKKDGAPSTLGTSHFIRGERKRGKDKGGAIVLGTILLSSKSVHQTKLAKSVLLVHHV